MSHRFKRFLAALVALVVVVVVVDVATGTYAIGATINFVWRALASSLVWSVQGLKELFILVLGRRVWGLASVATSVGFGYLLRVFLSDKHVRKVHDWREKFRRVLARVYKWWNGLTTVTKFAIVGVLIFLQIILAPAIARFIVLFPVGFMIPIIIGGVRRIYGWLTETIVGTLYRKYFGYYHNRAVRHVRMFRIVRVPRGAYRLARLQYVTAWRLWMHHPRYRDESGKRWRSGIEPIRLWWRGELKIYFGRRLLSGTVNQKDSQK